MMSVSSIPSRRAVQWGILATLLTALFGLVARLQILVEGLARPLATNIFFRLYALYEAPFLLITGVTAIAMVLVAIRKHDPVAGESLASDYHNGPGTRAVVLLATGTVLIALVVAHLVLHSYSFSMDEFSTDFQARIFASAQYNAELPAFWRPYALAITPVYVAFSGGSWHSVYLPVYALLKSPFVALGLGTLLNPILAGLTIVVIAAITRRLWPGEKLRPWVAIALLATSSEFIITSGTAYSMPAHLLLNLVWFWLYLRGDRKSWIAALIVGGLALGLHNPFPHALFVAPFLVRSLRDRRWRRLSSAAIAYGVASVVWFLWLRMSYPQASGGGLRTFFALPDLSVLWVHAINISLLFTWQAPLFGLLVIAALVQSHRLGNPLVDLAWGVVLTLVFYMFFPSTQGHGWGYRYAYQVLGNLALLGAAGVRPLREALGPRRARVALAVSFAVAVVIQLPLRFRNTESFVRPFAAGASYLRSRPADVVLVRGDSIWYGRDLIRNDPFLKDQPVIIYGRVISPAGRAALERAYPGRVVEVTDTELLRLGMTLWTHHQF